MVWWPSQSSTKTLCPSGQSFTSLLWELSDNESNDNTHHVAALDPPTPWLQEFNQYVKSHDELGKGQTIMKWWGVHTIAGSHHWTLLIFMHQLNSKQLPVWALLAADYLPIMASLVSSECAFSLAGITISKHHSCLKGDIVEALLMPQVHASAWTDIPWNHTMLNSWNSLGGWGSVRGRQLI